MIPIHDSNRYEWAVYTPEFPPPGIFGYSITKFVLRLDETLPVSGTSPSHSHNCIKLNKVTDAVTSYINTLPGLITFCCISFIPGGYLAKTILPLSFRALEAIQIQLTPYKYGMTRSALITTDLQPVLLHVFQGCPCIQRLQLKLKDNIPAFNSAWWTNRILDEISFRVR